MVPKLKAQADNKPRLAWQLWEGCSMTHTRSCCRSVITTDRFPRCEEAIGHIYAWTEIYICTHHTSATHSLGCNEAFEVVGVEYSAEWPDLLGHDPPPHAHTHLPSGDIGKGPMTGPQIPHDHDSYETFWNLVFFSSALPPSHCICVS